MNLKQMCTVSLMAFLVLLVGVYAVAAMAEQPLTVVIRIDSSGVVEVTVKASISEGLAVLPAPVEPIASTITAKVNGTPVPAVYSNGSIIVASDRQGVAVVDYYANTTSLPSGLLAFNVSYEGNYTLVVEPGIVLADIPENIVSVEVVNGSLLMLVTGPARVEYAVATAPPPPATTTPTATTATTTTTPQQPQTKTTATTTAPPTRTTTQTTMTVTSIVTGRTGTTTTATMVQRTTTATTAATATRATTTVPPAVTTATQRATTTAAAQTTTSTPEMPAVGAPTTTTPTARKGPSTLGIAVAVTIALAAILALLAALRGRGGSSASDSSGGPSGGHGGGGGSASVEPVLVTLDTTDKLILEKLREAGGSMYQSELQKATGLPKTTVWRHVRRLAQLGYVRVEREGKYNKVILVKYPEDEE